MVDENGLGPQAVDRRAIWVRCEEYWLKELQESNDRCTGLRYITEILLKKALNTIKAI